MQFFPATEWDEPFSGWTDIMTDSCCFTTLLLITLSGCWFQWSSSGFDALIPFFSLSLCLSVCVFPESQGIELLTLQSLLLIVEHSKSLTAFGPEFISLCSCLFFLSLVYLLSFTLNMLNSHQVRGTQTSCLSCHFIQLKLLCFLLLQLCHDWKLFWFWKFLLISIWGHCCVWKISHFNLKPSREHQQR